MAIDVVAPLAPLPPRPDVYHDTEHRYAHDPAFRAAVKTLEAIAVEHGFTPGELKQVAFMAALNVEMRRLPPGLILSELRPGERPRPPGVAGYLKDGTPVLYGRNR